MDLQRTGGNGALQKKLSLLPGEEARVLFYLGTGRGDAADEARKRYGEAGADAAFAVGCREPKELEQLARRVEGPLMVIINDNSRLNVFNCQDFADMGIKFVMYAATVRTLVLRQMTEALCALKQDGNTRAVLDRLASPADFQELTGLAAAQELEYRFS